jgi:hypothetical protein
LAVDRTRSGEQPHLSLRQEALSIWLMGPTEG